MKKSTHPFLHILVLLALMLLLALAVGILSAIPTLSGVDVMHGTGLYVLQTLAQIMMFVVPVVLVVAFYYGAKFGSFMQLDFGGRKWLSGVAAVAVILLLIPVNDWLTVWNDSWNLGTFGEHLRGVQDKTEGVVEELMSATGWGGLVANLFVVALVPAVCEEVFFRAGMQNLFLRWFGRSGKTWGVHVSVLLTAAIFSLFHGEVFSFVPRFVLGAVLGYMYVCSGSILPNMLAHFFNNAMVVVVYWTVSMGWLEIDLEEPLRCSWILTTACTIGAALLFWTMFAPTDSNKVVKG